MIELPPVLTYEQFENSYRKNYVGHLEQDKSAVDNVKRLYDEYLSICCLQAFNEIVGKYRREGNVQKMFYLANALRLLI